MPMNHQKGGNRTDKRPIQGLWGWFVRKFGNQTHWQDKYYTKIPEQNEPWDNSPGFAKASIRLNEAWMRSIFIINNYIFIDLKILPQSFEKFHFLTN